MALDPTMAAMLKQHVDAAEYARLQAESLGSSFVYLLGFNVGDIVDFDGAIRFKADKIKFELHCYLRQGVWHAGFRVVGRQMIGNVIGSSGRSAVFDLDGNRVGNLAA